VKRENNASNHSSNDSILQDASHWKNWIYLAPISTRWAFLCCNVGAARLFL
jgi:hypothetical protein